jgi:hypothetical protein
LFHDSLRGCFLLICVCCRPRQGKKLSCLLTIVATSSAAAGCFCTLIAGARRLNFARLSVSLRETPRNSHHCGGGPHTTRAAPPERPATVYKASRRDGASTARARCYALCSFPPSHYTRIIKIPRFTFIYMCKVV